VTVVVSINGKDRRHGVDKIATQPAVLNAYVTTLHRRPDLVISAGTAGGWAKHGTQVGDVFVSRDHFVFHDRRIALPGFEDYGIGTYPTVDASGLAAALGLKQGVVSSGNSLDESAEDREAFARSGAMVKEMEAAAVAWVADLLSVPMMAIKSITDLVDSPAPTSEQFLMNLRHASQRLTDVLMEVFDYCDGRTIQDLSRVI
jgi:nucleoside phosphorylase